MFHGYPNLYFQRGKQSDLKFIMQRMSVIPETLKESVSRQYMSFNPANGGDSRKAANTWLNDEAMKYRKPAANRDAIGDVKIEPKQPESRQVEFKSKTNIIAPQKGKSFLDSLLDDVDRKRAKRKESA